MLTRAWRRAGRGATRAWRRARRGATSDEEIDEGVDEDDKDDEGVEEGEATTTGETECDSAGTFRFLTSRDDTVRLRDKMIQCVYVFLTSFLFFGLSAEILVFFASTVRLRDKRMTIPRSRAAAEIDFVC